MKRKASVRRRLGPGTLTGSREAKRMAAGLLEVLSGVRGPKLGSEALGISLNRYYQLETRALQGFLTALEPKARGRQKSSEDQVKALERRARQLEQELVRQQALVRAAQRSLGLPSVPREEPGGKGGGRGKKGRPARRRCRVVRAMKAVAALRPATETSEGTVGPGAAGGR
jgi:hypothetical protein